MLRQASGDAETNAHTCIDRQPALRVAVKVMRAYGYKADNISKQKIATPQTAAFRLVNRYRQLAMLSTGINGYQGVL